jgi:hypothetical protein
MRSIALPLLAFLPASLLIACGPSEAELKSARNLDQAVRQLNTVCEDFIQGISNEGQLTRVNMSDYYSGYPERIQTINQDLAGKTLVDDYRNFRARFDSVSRETNRLIQAHEEYISEVVDMLNALEEFSEKVSRAEESEYNTFEYLSEAYVKEREFKRSEGELDSLKSRLRSRGEAVEELVGRYNQSITEKATQDSVRHCTEIDSLPDFVGETQVLMETFTFDYGRYNSAMEEVRQNVSNQ